MSRYCQYCVNNGFRNGQSTHHCLLFMLESLKKALDNGISTSILHAYGFSRTTLHLVHDYLSERKKRTKIGTTYCSWREII